LVAEKTSQRAQKAFSASEKQTVRIAGSTAVFVKFKEEGFKVRTVHRIQCERVFMSTTVITIDSLKQFFISSRRVVHFV